MSSPLSPPAARRRAPSWLDLRLITGVSLVVVSVVAGFRLVGAAGHTSAVWSVVRDLAAGTILTSADVAVTRARLPDSATRYLSATHPVAGRTLRRAVGAGELLPRATLEPRPCGAEMSIPVAPRHVPASVRHGVRVDVFATHESSGSVVTRRVLDGVAVQAVSRPQSGFVAASAEWAVVVRLAETLVPPVVHALRSAEIDLVVASGDAPGDGCGREPAGTSSGPADAGPPTDQAMDPPGPTPTEAESDASEAGPGPSAGPEGDAASPDGGPRAPRSPTGPVATPAPSAPR